MSGLDGQGPGLCPREKNLVEGNPGSSEADPLARAPLPDGLSVPRGFPNDAVTRPSAPPGAQQQMVQHPSSEDRCSMPRSLAIRTRT